MIQVLVDIPDATAAWVASQLPEIGTREAFGPFRAAAVVDGDRPLAGVVYNEYRERTRDVQMTIASVDPRWCSRGTLRALFHIPFEQMKCVRVSALTARDNKRARSMLGRLGFKLEGVKECGWDGHRDLMAYGMLKTRCPWLPKDGKRL